GCFNLRREAAPLATWRLTHLPIVPSHSFNLRREAAPLATSSRPNSTQKEQCFNLRREAAPLATYANGILLFVHFEFQSQARSRSPGYLASRIDCSHSNVFQSQS